MQTQIYVVGYPNFSPSVLSCVEADLFQAFLVDIHVTVLTGSVRGRGLYYNESVSPGILYCCTTDSISNQYSGEGRPSGPDLNSQFVGETLFQLFVYVYLLFSSPTVGPWYMFSFANWFRFCSSYTPSACHRNKKTRE